VGQVHTGRVVRLTEFGAFVELAPGVEALAHASTFPPGQADAWRKAVPVGKTAAFEIRTVDLDTKRIGVALAPEGANVEDVREYSERRPDAGAESFGSLADKLRGALGTRTK
jgi:ribosomal protein S1